MHKKIESRKIRVARKEQDALTTTRVIHCLIVCTSQKNVYNQLQKIICFKAGNRVTEKAPPGGDKGGRGLC